MTDKELAMRFEDEWSFCWLDDLLTDEALEKGILEEVYNGEDIDLQLTEYGKALIKEESEMTDKELTIKELLVWNYEDTFTGKTCYSLDLIYTDGTLHENFEEFNTKKEYREYADKHYHGVFLREDMLDLSLIHI